MQEKDKIAALEAEIAELRHRLDESSGIVEAIRNGSVDALVVTRDGAPQVYSMVSADYTYRVLIEKFGEGALSLSDEGLILYCNEHFAKLVGRPANKITGTYFAEYTGALSDFNRLRSGLISGPSKSEIILKTDTGGEVHVLASFSDLYPNVEAIGVVITDLTEKRRHEDALLHYQRKLELKVQELNSSNENLEQFIHVISHDIKEPLRKILTYTSHLAEAKSELFTGSELKSMNVINQSAVRLNSLVDDLVKYAFSATRAEMSPISLNRVMREVLDDLELMIRENNATISLTELPEIEGSKIQMRQLFSNLLSNAIKYSRKGVPPKVKITTSVADGIDPLEPQRQFHHIAISDNGIGMEASQIGKIYTIFQRLHMRDEFSGNGIGLAICKKIMENHHGRIEAQSVVGQGSTFNLFFPVVFAKP